MALHGSSATAATFDSNHPVPTTATATADATATPGAASGTSCLLGEAVQEPGSGVGLVDMGAVGPDEQQWQQQQGFEQEPGKPAPSSGSEEEGEAREEGAVAWRVYATYLAHVGWGMVTLVIVSLLAMQVRPDALPIGVHSQNTSFDDDPS